MPSGSSVATRIVFGQVEQGLPQSSNRPARSFCSPNSPLGMGDSREIACLKSVTRSSNDYGRRRVRAPAQSSNAPSSDRQWSRQPADVFPSQSFASDITRGGGGAGASAFAAGVVDRAHVRHPRAGQRALAVAPPVRWQKGGCSPSGLAASDIAQNSIGSDVNPWGAVSSPERRAHSRSCADRGASFFRANWITTPATSNAPNSPIAICRT